MSSIEYAILILHITYIKHITDITTPTLDSCPKISDGLNFFELDGTGNTRLWTEDTDMRLCSVDMDGTWCKFYDADYCGTVRPQCSPDLQTLVPHFNCLSLSLSAVTQPHPACPVSSHPVEPPTPGRMQFLAQEWNRNFAKRPHDFLLMVVVFDGLKNRIVTVCLACSTGEIS